ncbi:two component response regulator KdpE [Sulfobacillus acidophilus TPY]|uniref:Stage 0 sporulation protein A homolog n=1 Tax=Sulfobacillus acidophilus (strain ATCC 700253 / DSM 10332 / NAL) TaxID=679936 RepID=G8TUD7_SULAD|nr:two component response regulator KdpE [Sulfobacillus acidophilus TPY]AEW06899.1 response regulator receiver protein [Sulfobacillus acidophilus DSM 10332]MCY0864517.1 response regulator [Sulfobacillus sp.]
MKQVLVIDDEPSIRQVVRLALEPLGLSVTEAASAQAALLVLRDVVPDVVLLDYRLPDMTGIELAHLLYPQFPQLPVILLSASWDWEPTPLPTGIIRFMTKPFRLRELQAAVTEQLARDVTFPLHNSGTL